MDRPILTDPEETMSHRTSQPTPTASAQSVRASAWTGQIGASVSSLRSVAFSLLADRALSA
jgi:hypothetical protein